MSGETIVTVVGNLVDEVEMRFLPNGTPVSKFRVASTPRTFDRDSNSWKDGESLFLTCSVWRQAAENAAESLTRGMRVIVQGRLKQRSYEKDGAKHTVYELDVEEVGPSLRSATAKVTKASSGNSGQGGGRQEYAQARQQQAAGSGDPWGAAAQQAGQAAGSWGGDEPPF